MTGPTKPRVVVTHWVHPEVIALLEERAEVAANLARETWQRARVIELAKDADALLAFMPDIVDAEFLNACPRLKIVAAALKGFDDFDVAAMTERGVWFTMVPDLLTAPTAELALALVLGIERRVSEGDRFVRSGRFAGWRPELYGTAVAGNIIGIVGMGAIGRNLGALLAGFDSEILYYDQRRLDEYEEIGRGWTYMELDRLLSIADFVVLCLPLSEETFHLIGARRLAAMKPGGFLVNVCRGSVVDERAVAEALEAGRLAGYAADVFELEDTSRPGRPEAIPRSLIEHPRTLFTPHLGSAVDEVRVKIERRCALNILQALKGETPQDAVNLPSRFSDQSAGDSFVWRQASSGGEENKPRERFRQGD